MIDDVLGSVQKRDKYEDADTLDFADDYNFTSYKIVCNFKVSTL